MNLWTKILSLLHQLIPNEADKLQGELLHWSEDKPPAEAIRLAISFLAKPFPAVKKAAMEVFRDQWGKLKFNHQTFQHLRWTQMTSEIVLSCQPHVSQSDMAILWMFGSIQSDGFFRQRAMEELTIQPSPEAIPFILFRLGDWRPEVRAAAQKAMAPLLHSQYLEHWLNFLPWVINLENVNRVDLSGQKAQILHFIFVQNRAEVLKTAKKHPGNIRLLIANQIAYSSEGNPADFAWMVADRYFPIRFFVLQYSQHLSESHLEKLANDPSGRVRHLASTLLHALSPSEERLINSLADSSANVRYMARYYLRDRKMDFVSFYLEKLAEGNQLVGAMMGLAELNAGEHAGKVEAYLHDPKLTVRQAAFSALVQLDGNAAEKFALGNWGVETGKMKRRIMEYLSKQSNSTFFGMQLENYRMGNCTEKIALIHWFIHQRNWRFFPDLLEGLSDPCIELRKEIYRQLPLWWKRMTNVYHNPSPEDLIRSKAAYHKAVNHYAEKGEPIPAIYNWLGALLS